MSGSKSGSDQKVFNSSSPTLVEMEQSAIFTLAPLSGHL